MSALTGRYGCLGRRPNRRHRKRLQKKVEISGWGLERAGIQAAPLRKNLEIDDWSLKVNW